METQLKKSRMEQIDRWADYIRTHPEEWRKQHTAFIDAQLEIANTFLKNLAKQPGGREKIAEIRRIKNQKFLDEFCR